MDSWILFSLEFTANANRFRVPTRLLTKLKLFCLIFSKSKAEVPSAFAVIPAISNLLTLLFFKVLKVRTPDFGPRVYSRLIPQNRVVSSVVI